MRWLVRLVLRTRLTHELAQMLAISLRKYLQQLGQCIVAFGDQAITPLFDAMQVRGLPPRMIAVMIENGADRFQLVLAPAQLFGEKLGLALARDLLGNGAGAHYFIAQFIGQRYARELRVG